MMHNLIFQKATRGKQNMEQDSREQRNFISLATISLSLSLSLTLTLSLSLSLSITIHRQLSHR
jgi:hypothetical protein